MIAHAQTPLFFFFNDTATTEIYTLSLHDALPILRARHELQRPHRDPRRQVRAQGRVSRPRDRKSTRLNSSHSQISYAVFCLKKKKSEPRRTLSLRRATSSQRSRLPFTTAHRQPSP